MGIFKDIKNQDRERYLDEWINLIGENIGVYLNKEVEEKLQTLDINGILEIKTQKKGIKKYTYEGEEIFAYSKEEGLLNILEYEKTINEESFLNDKDIFLNSNKEFKEEVETSNLNI